MQESFLCLFLHFQYFCERSLKMLCLAFERSYITITDYILYYLVPPISMKYDIKCFIVMTHMGLHILTTLFINSNYNSVFIYQNNKFIIVTEKMLFYRRTDRIIIMLYSH